MKRYKLLLLLVFVVCMMTGCGANVTSELHFNQDGSGTRSVTAVISESDAKNLDDGFYELDTLLEQAAPQGVSLGRTMLDNGDAKYEFVFNFDNIADYNKKVEAITGKPHDATWYTNTSVFLSDISFKETQCTKDLIQWALDAFKNSKYASFGSNFTLYKVGKNKVYYKDDLKYDDTGDPEFTVQNSAKLTNVSMFSDYNKDGTYAKKLVLTFEKGSLDKIDLAAAGKLLDPYTTEYTIDTANSKITFDLKDKQVNEFLGNADPSYDDNTFCFLDIQNIFQKHYNIEMSYNLGKFLDQFSTDYPYIYDYIKLPENLALQKIRRTNQANDIEVPEGYDLAGLYRFDTDYEFSYLVNQVVKLQKVSVTYHLENNYEGDRTVKIYLNKNECSITQTKLKEFYKDLTDTIEYADGDTESVISFISKFKAGDEVKNSYSDYVFEKSKKKNLKNVEYKFDESLDVSKYLPQVEDYDWDLKNINLDYEIYVNKNAGLRQLQLNDKSYEPYKVATQQGLLPQTDNKDYVFAGTINADKPLKMNVNFRMTNKMFYFWIIFIIFILLVAGGGAAYYYLRKRKQSFQKNLEGYEFDEYQKR